MCDRDQKEFSSGCIKKMKQEAANLVEINCNSQKKVISKNGIRIRKAISPVFRFMIPFLTPNSKLEILRRADIPKEPVIFATTHGFREVWRFVCQLFLE